MNNFQKKIFRLGKVENFEVRNNRLILFLIGPTMFIYSYYVQSYEDDSIKIKGAKVFFALLFLVGSLLPFIFKKSIHYFYGWIVFLLMLSFSHYLLVHLALNNFNIRFIVGFYTFVFGSILLFNKRTFINIYLVITFIHLVQKLTISAIDHAVYKSILGSFALIVIFALIILNDTTAYRSSLANSNRILEKNRIELIKIAKDLEERNKDLEEFANVVSHDLRTPLGNVMALFSWLQQDYEKDNKEHIKEHLGLIENEVLRMDSILEGVLSYSLQNKITIDNEKVNLNLLVMDLKEVHEHKKCEIIIKKVLPTIQINRSQIFLVFQNLIQNAIKFNHKKVCKITIDYTLENEVHTFSIKDNGIGIDESYHKKIFELFQKLKVEKTNGSNGMGLAVVKKIINNNKGQIYLKSEINVGSTFYFTLPA
ncbi:MAG: signal transduction histidine kinase [Maribacter sp.]|jgi:signal transduction histidine kinase